MEKRNIRHSLFWRISFSFLAILLLLGVAYVSITAYSARHYFQETTQKLNAHVADHMLLEVNPFVDGAVNEEAVGKIMHSMMAVNPSLEVYLLDPAGEILKYVVLDKKVRLKSIDLAPVKSFIASKGADYITGDDPRQPGAQTIFSATAVEQEGELLGYVYLVLASEEYENVSQALLSSYFLRIGTQGFVLTLLAAFLIGVLLIYFLTANLRKITTAVRQFEQGDYTQRIAVTGKGELASLSRTFNHMADTILKNIDDLKQVDELRRELIANVSHDLRSPLAVMSGYVETLIMQEDQLDKEQRRKYLEIVHKSGHRLNRLVGDLFELSKLEANQVNFHAEQFNMNELIQDTALQFEILAQSKDLRIKTNFTEAGLALGDLGLIQRVVQNLLDNAVKYSAPNSEVSISTQRKDDKIEVSFVNTGAKIPEQDIPHVFDRYYKKERHNTESTGLGLAIVKKIIDVHEASIAVHQTPDDETVFSFILPAA